MNDKAGGLLLIDDKTDLLSLFYSYVKKEGRFRVERVQSSREAHQRLVDQHYDILISNDSTLEGKKLDNFALSRGIKSIKLINARKSSKNSHFTLRSSDIIVLEDMHQRVEYPLSSTRNIQGLFRSVSDALLQMMHQKIIRRQFEETYGDPYDVLCAAPLPMCIVTNDAIGWANEEMAHFLGYTPISLPGMQLQEIFPSKPEYTDFLSSVRAKMHASGWCQTDSVLRKRDGTLISSRVKIQRIGATPHNNTLILIFEDRTCQQRLQKVIDSYEGKIRKQGLQHDDLLRNVEGIVVRTDIEGNISFFNRTAEELFGYPAKEVIGKNIVDILLLPDDRAARDLSAMIADCSGNPEEYTVLAVFHPTRNGQEICVAWKIIGLREQDRLTEVVCIGQDITDYERPGSPAIRTDPWKSRLLEGTDIGEEVFDAVLHICIELSREGREGRKVGTSFVIGDSEAVMTRSKQLTLNSFEGQEMESRMVTNPYNKECIKNFAQLDGAFVVRGDGFVEASGRQFLVENVKIHLPPGFGTRHASVAGITSLTKSVGVVVSEGAGKTTIFRDGNIIKSLVF